VKSRAKPQERGRNTQNKRSRQDDIPPEVKPELGPQVTALRDLQNHLHCAAHLKPGMIMYCWVGLGQPGTKGGHCEMSHEELMLWAQYIVSDSKHATNKDLCRDAE
jgi:hypothetical protein